MIQLIKDLCALDGISGDEGNVRDYIISQIKDHCVYNVDAIGNILCYKKGFLTPKKKLVIAAHMDEVGLIATGVTEEGLVKFTTVGGIDKRVLLGRKVKFYRSGIVGVIGTKAMHQQSPAERGTAVNVDDMYIDIGSKNRKYTQKNVEYGDGIAFMSDCKDFGNGYLKGKALDDRIGCAMLIDMIKTGTKCDTFFMFSVQEEVGLRGAKVGAFNLQPDYAIVVEATTAADIPGVSDEKQVCKLGNGAVVGFMDRATIYNTEMYKLAYKVAMKNDIPIQNKTMIAGGNDSGAIHISRNGVKTIAVSVPCRYLHTPSCLVKKEDVQSTYRLVQAIAEEVL